MFLGFQRFLSLEVLRDLFRHFWRFLNIDLLTLKDDHQTFFLIFSVYVNPIIKILYIVLECFSVAFPALFYYFNCRYSNLYSSDSLKGRVKTKESFTHHIRLLNYLGHLKIVSRLLWRISSLYPTSHNEYYKLCFNKLGCTKSLKPMYYNLFHGLKFIKMDISH